EHVRIAWSLIRRENPLLMCKILVDGNDTTTARFSLSPPLTSDSAVQETGAALRFSSESKDQLISAYMDGPRILSNVYLSYLVISRLDSSDDSGTAQFNLFMHSIGDGSALHQSTQTDAELLEQLKVHHNWGNALPLPMESRLPHPHPLLGKAACKINYLQTLSKEIGGHTFSRVQRGPKRTLFQEHEFSEAQTSAILSHCKKNSVAINHDLTALSTVAWARCTTQSRELPIMLYTAANLRPHLAPQTSTSQWFLALTYFTISLPAFIPTTPAAVWHRARAAKTQMQRAVRSPLLTSRALLGAASRARRTPTSSSFAPPNPIASSDLPTRPAASAALFGISLIGDLDRTYVRIAYGPGVHLRSVATASRLKPGGLLLLGHTFGGRLVLQLCWDSMGFAEHEVERFWAALPAAINEFLC
ncbi:hypothetical protein C8J57DRAFT_1093051, partial [Mycena rebaudengoi]